MLSSWVQPSYLRPDFRARLRKKYLLARPTPHMALASFFIPAKFMAVQKALLSQEFSRKESDLFSFSQTGDLHASRNPIMREFLALLKSKEFAKFMQEITGVNLKAGKVDAAGFLYEDTDHLLCHDDELTGRRIAYVVNFSDLTPRTGGALLFFNSNNKKEPTIPATRVFPKRNTLTFFTVTPTSHHMVEEVIGAKRLSIAGWIHG
jgi:prolyl 3-hydroxylase /prolyl 3,4-dihydroxylase